MGGGVGERTEPIYMCVSLPSAAFLFFGVPFCILTLPPLLPFPDVFPSSQCPLPAGAGKIVAITCGENHNLVLARKSSTASCVYTWGFGESGALGQGGADEDEMRPKAIDLAKAKLPNVTMVQMAAGGQHTALLGEVTKAK